jgi:hypothetical protein
MQFENRSPRAVAAPPQPLPDPHPRRSPFARAMAWLAALLIEDFAAYAAGMHPELFWPPGAHVNGYAPEDRPPRSVCRRSAQEPEILRDPSGFGARPQRVASRQGHDGAEPS